MTRDVVEITEKMEKAGYEALQNSTALDPLKGMREIYRAMDAARVRAPVVSPEDTAADRELRLTCYQSAGDIEGAKRLYAWVKGDA